MRLIPQCYLCTFLFLTLFTARGLAVSGFQPPQATATLPGLQLTLLSEASDPFVIGESFKVRGPGHATPIPVSSTFVPPRSYRISIPASELTSAGTLFVTEIDTDGITEYSEVGYTINPPPHILHPLELPEDTLPGGTLGVAYSFQSIFTGGTAPLTWSFTGTAPEGITVNASTGVISGTPTQLGSFTLVLKLTDALGVFHTEERFLTILGGTGPLRITTTSPLPDAFRGMAYSKRLAATGGALPYTKWEIVSGSLPGGIILNLTTGELSGTANADANAAFTARVTDSASVTATKAFTLAVVAPALSCEISPRNAVYAGHETSNHLGDTPIYPDHYLSVTVRLGTAPVEGVPVTMNSDVLTFAEGRVLPASKTSVVTTGANGVARFRVNPDVTREKDRASLTAGGTSGGQNFECSGSLMTELGGSLSSLEMLNKPAAALAFLRQANHELEAYGRKHEDELEEILSADAALRERIGAAKRRYGQLATSYAAGKQTNIAGLEEYQEFAGILTAIGSHAKGELLADTARLKQSFEQGPLPTLVGLPTTSAPVVVEARQAAASIGGGDPVGRLPVVFEPNRGQADASAQFLNRGPGYTAFFTERGVILADNRGAIVPAGTPPLVRMEWRGANDSIRILGEGALESVSHYLKGPDQDKWVTGVPHFASVRYERVYPGIDVAFHAASGKLEFDLLVAPGADPTEAWLEFPDSRSAEIQPSGDLLLRQDRGQLRLTKPLLYQENASGVRQEVAGGFVVRDGRVGFSAGSYDRSRPLVIDPAIDYSSFLGGATEDTAMQLALDALGNILIAGGTFSADFPLTQAVNGAHPGPANMDVFVTKLNPEGTAIVYSAFIGGSASEAAAGLAVDLQGNAYVTGGTASSNYPVSGPAQVKHPGLVTGDEVDAFVFKLNSGGNALLYSTSFGGSRLESGKAIAVDAAGNAYITGFTTSPNFPVNNALQPALAPNDPNSAEGFFGSDAFVTKLNAEGTAFVYSTYLGGNEGDAGTGIAVDATRNVYVSGTTYSKNFPTAAAVQSVSGGFSDAFAAALNPAGTTLMFSTYLGGSSDDMGMGLALDGSANIYLTGLTGSPDFPVLDAAQQQLAGGALGLDAFVTKLAPGGAFVRYSTFLGGSGVDSAAAITVTANGSAYVTGASTSIDFPSAGFPALYGGRQDAFLAQLAPDGSQFTLAHLFGGLEDDSTGGVVVDSQGNIILAGGSMSLDFPVTLDGLQPDAAGRTEAFVTKVTPGGATPFFSVSSARFSGTVSPDSIATGLGAGLSAGTADAQGVPKRNLGNATLKIRDALGAEHESDLYYVSPAQINYHVPAAAAVGLAEAIVLSNGLPASSGTVRIENVAPAFFTANASGRGTAAALSITVHADDSNSVALTFACNGQIGGCTGSPINVSNPANKVFISLYGTGIRRRTALDKVTATVGGISVPVAYAGLQATYPGMDQVNIGPLPTALTGKGNVDVVLVVDGIAANVVTVAIQ